MRLSLVVLSFLGVNLFALKPNPASPAATGASSSYELIDAVNQVRAANGLSAYRIDEALMAAAQGHSETMAETGDVSHTGAGGSSPASRAAAAGYSGSGVVENIMSGNNISPQQAVQWWQGDGLHLSTLLSTEAEDAGAGAASSGDTVYYTLVVGHKGGGSGSGGSAAQQPPSSTGDTASQSMPPPTIEVITAIKVATPGADGSIIHAVKQGQTLWNIATAYKIPLADLYAMNGLTDQSVIFPGERIIIQLPSKTLTPTLPGSGPAAAPSASATPRLTSTEVISATMVAAEMSLSGQTPTSKPAVEQATQTKRATAVKTKAAATETPQAAAAAANVSRGNIGVEVDPFLAIIAVLIFVGTALILAGAFLKRSA